MEPLPPRRAEEILADSDEALRLLDSELTELRGEAASTPLGVDPVELPRILEAANQQVLRVLAHLRASREALQQTTYEKLQTTHDKIREVNSATEDAATNIMDACDRANALVDELDAIDAADAPDRERGATVRNALRDELFVMMGALQFQDITSQQLAHASAVLVEMENRLTEVAHLFDAGATVTMDVASSLQPPNADTYDPNATVKNAAGRQALADELFAPKPPA